MPENYCYNPKCRRPVHEADEACPFCSSPLWLRGRRYRVVQRLKATRLSTVYDALDCVLANRRCAIKCVEARSDGDLARMQNEVEILATSGLPFIPTIQDRWDDGMMHYFMMEFIVGATLDQVHAGPWNPADASDMLAQLLGYFDQMHQRGIYHRDIKPSNIMLASEGPHRGEYVLIDFNIAKNTALYGDETHDWNRGLTLLYAAPEQISGHETDARSDLYSLGRTAYALLSATGKPQDRFQLDDLPPALDRTLCALLQSDPDRRPASAREALALLRTRDTDVDEIGTADPPMPAADTTDEQTQLTPPSTQLTVLGCGRANGVAWQNDGGKSWLLVASSLGVYRYDPDNLTEGMPWVELRRARRVALVNSGDQLAIAADQAIELFRLPDRKRMPAPEDNLVFPGEDLVFAPGGATAAAIDRGQLCVWLLGDGGLHTKMPVQVDSYRLALGNQLAAVAGTQSIQVLRLASGSIIHTLNIANQPVVAMALAPDEATLAVGYHDRLTLLRVATGELLADLPLAQPARALAFDQRGERLAIAAGDKLLLWRFSADRSPRILGENIRPVEALAFELDSGRLAAVCDGKLQIYHVGKNSPPTHLPMHNPGAWLLARIATDRVAAAFDETLKLYAVETAGQITCLSERPIDTGALALAASPDGTRLALGTGQRVSIWQLPELIQLLDLPTGVACAGGLTFVDESTLVVAAPSGLERWNIDQAILIDHQQLEHLSNQIAGVALAGYVAVLNHGLMLQAWSASSMIWQARQRDINLNGLALAPGGQRLALVGEAATQLWNIGDYDPIDQVAVGGQAIAFSSDGELLATLDRRSIRLWRSQGDRLEQVQVLDGHAETVLAIAFLDNSRRLISSSLDGTLRVWDCSQEGLGHG